MSTLETVVHAKNVQGVGVRYEDGDGHFYLLVDGIGLSPLIVKVHGDANKGRRSVVAKQLLRQLRDDIDAVLEED